MHVFPLGSLQMLARICSFWSQKIAVQPVQQSTEKKKVGQIIFGGRRIVSAYSKHDVGIYRTSTTPGLPPITRVEATEQ